MTHMNAVCVSVTVSSVDTKTLSVWGALGLALHSKSLLSWSHTLVLLRHRLCWQPNINC